MVSSDVPADVLHEIRDRIAAHARPDLQTSIDGLLLSNVGITAAAPEYSLTEPLLVVLPMGPSVVEAAPVVVTPAPYVEPLAALVAHGHRPRVAASGRLAGSGPGVFLPAHGAAEDIAGQGVANPASMLLAAALLLGEGLGERRAAETLAGAVLEACSNGTRTPDMVSTGVGATTREFTDVVLSELPGSLTNAEFYREAVA